MAARLGWRLDDIPPPVQALAGGVDRLVTALGPFHGSDPASEEIGELVAAVRALVDAITGLATATFEPQLLADGFESEFPARLIEFLITEYLVMYHPTVAFAAKALGVMRETYVAKTATRPAYSRRELAWIEVTQLVTDPAVVLENAYGWRTQQFDSQDLLGTLAGLLASIKLNVVLESVPAAEAEVIEGMGPLLDAPVRWRLDVPLFRDGSEAELVETGVRVLPLPGDGTHLPGMAIMPYAFGEFAERFPLDDHLAFTVRSSLDLQGGVAVRVRPNEPIEVLTGFAAGSPSHATGMVSGRIEYADPTLLPWTIIGTDSGSRIEALSLAGVGALRLDTSTEPDLSIEFELTGGRIVIAPGEGDGFLRRVLPPGGFSASFDLAIGLSTKRGVYFRGSGGLSVTVPIHATLGPVSLESLTFDVRASAAGVPITVGATLSVSLGPIVAVAKNVGLRAALAFPGSGGNLGPLDVDVGFKAPDGIGLSLDGGGFRGGGYIEHDEARGRYAGIVNLEFQSSIAVTGIGILDTRLPDGRDGYSLLIAISAQFAAIQLGMGFTLNGVGGFIGVNRTARIDVLRASLRDHTLNSLLFPDDPIENADRIIRDLDRVFPQAPGQIVFGPMAKFGWGTPTLITADLGLIIELPDPVRIAIIGVVRCVLPDPDAPLLVLQANFLGTINLDKGYLAFDASLFESRLLSFKIDGDMSARLTLGLIPSLLLAVGGFHPAYKPPPMELPTMRRVVISLLADDNPRLRAEVYFARTANSFQFGANVELYVAVSKFNIHGVLGFDVLLQIKPTFFSASVRASLAVCIGDDPILSVGVDFTLEGPAPWHAKGSAHFKICWFLSFSKSFDRTWGDEQQISALEIDVLPLLVAALSSPANWRAKLPDAVHQLVQFRDTTLGLIDPAGTLEISQNVVPLNLTIDRFSGAKPRDADRFWISSITSRGDELDNDPTTEEFAPAEFLDLSDAEKLGRPSFEPFTSGVVITGAAELVADHVVTRDIQYEEIIVDRVSPGRSNGTTKIPLSHFVGLIQGGAVSRSPFAKNLGFTPDMPKILVATETYVVASTTDLRAVSDRVELTHAQAIEEMKRMMKESPNLEGMLHVMPGYAVSA